MKPDAQLVTAAQRITNAANVHTIQKALKWYEHWCRVGNIAAAQVSEQTLRTEIAKTWKASRQHRRAS